MSALPRWSTPRTEGRPTVGGDVAKVAGRLGLTCPCATCAGRPLMPHQRLIADVAGEVLPSGRMAYPVVVIILPRRGGKTGLMLPTALQRVAWVPRGRAWYTAQTGKDAGETFRDDWLELVKGSPLRRSVKTRASNGSESITVNRSRGKLGVFAPGPKALHGKDCDVGIIDEGWAFSEAKGSEVESGIRPAMLTRPRRQLFIISAGGNADSTWLMRWRELGRALTGPDQGLAYFEWHPEVDAEGKVCVDLADPAVWAATHPAVGHTIALDALVDDRVTFGESEFNRAYLDVFQGSASGRVIPALGWEASLADGLDGRPDVKLDPGPLLSLSYDVAVDRSAASVSLAGRVGPRLAVEVVDHRPGVEWVAARVNELRNRYRVRVVADSFGPAVTVTRQLRDLGVEPVLLDTGDVLAAAAELLDDVLTPLDRSDPASPHTLAHRGQRPLDDAVEVAAKREVGDGWALTRKGSAGDVTALVSASLAAHDARHRTAAAPEIRFG